MTDRGDLNGIALDLGGTKLAAARVIEGQVTDRLMRPTDGTAPAAAMVAEMHNMAQALGLAADDPVGLAVTGRVTEQGIWRAVNDDTLPGLGNANLLALAQGAFARSVTVRNDALAAALAEYRFGAGTGSAAMAYVTVSTGVGGGLVLGGRPVMSRDGLAGHLGFSTTRLGRNPCGSGRVGTVESVASGRAIAAEAVRRGHPVEDAKQVFEHWHASEHWADEIVDLSASAIAELAANLVAILGIDRIVLGGSVGLAKGYAKRVRHQLREEPPLYRPRIVPALMGHDAVLLGALLPNWGDGGT